MTDLIKASKIFLSLFKTLQSFFPLYFLSNFRSDLFTSQSAAIRWGSYSGISEICG